MSGFVYPPPYALPYGAGRAHRPNRPYRAPYGTVQALATIAGTAAANLDDGDTVTVNDGIGSGDIVFEFDTVPDGVAGGNVAVDISAAVGGDDVIAALLAAMQSVFPASAAIVAEAGSAPTNLVLRHLSPGASGNNGTVVSSDVDLVVSNFSGGIDGEWLPVRIGPWHGLLPAPEVAVES